MNDTAMTAQAPESIALAEALDDETESSSGHSDSASNTKEDRHFVTALARGLEVLSCFRSRDKLLGNQELARRCGLPKSTISRLTYTLTKLGYLEHDPELGRYRLGSATLSLGSVMLSRMDVRQIARPLMQQLADSSQTMVSLGSRDRLSMIYVENCRSDAALTLSLDVGSRIPLATTAMGRAYLARCGEAERHEIMERAREYDEYAWPNVRRGIDRAMEEHRTLGVCCSFGDWQPDVNAIAVAFYARESRMLMSLNCGGPAFIVSKEHLMDHVRPQMIRIAERLSAA
ncbi:IclR family transcriptional regulator [Aquabacterium soli]|nr:IclR family transcriptional regulator [Aquabacterium soli]